MKNDAHDDWNSRTQVFDEFGNIKIGTEDLNSRTPSDALNKKLSKVLNGFAASSFLTILWVMGAFYSFVFEKNNSVGSIFLLLIMICQIYYQVAIWKVQKQ